MLGGHLVAKAVVQVPGDRVGAAHTHLWPGTDPEASLRAASAGYAGDINVAAPGLVVGPV